MKTFSALIISFIFCMAAVAKADIANCYVDEVAVFSNRIHAHCGEYLECNAGNSGKVVCDKFKGGTGSKFDYFALPVTDPRATLVLNMLMSAQSDRLLMLGINANVLSNKQQGLVQWGTGANADLNLTNNTKALSRAVSMLEIEYDAKDLSGEKFGCLNSNCRPIISVKTHKTGIQD